MDFQKQFTKETGWALKDEPFSSGPHKAVMPDGSDAGYYDWAHRYHEWLETHLSEAVKMAEFYANKTIHVDFDAFDREINIGKEARSFLKKLKEVKE